MLDQRAYRLSPGGREVFRRLHRARRQRPRFAHGRSIRNAIDRARLRQASRLFESDRVLERDELITIEAEDILKSSVFAQSDD